MTGDQIAGPGLIEVEYWLDIKFLNMPVCCRCGAPFEAMHDVGDAYELVECAACIARKPAFDRARAVFIYDDLTSRIILRFKNGADRNGLKLMSQWCVDVAGDLVRDADFVMAVPLHASRLRSRGYNQSLWLAAAIARRRDLKLAHHILKRRRNTPSQAGRSAVGRQKNVEGAFHIAKRHHKKIAGKRILLVDDVYTTGATVEACCRALKRSGATSVDVITLSRVVSPTDPTI